MKICEKVLEIRNIAIQDWNASSCSVYYLLISGSDGVILFMYVVCVVEKIDC